jgi:hypothetical protein
MAEQWERPWLEIPAPDYMPVCDPEEWDKPKTRGDDDHDKSLDDERRVIIIEL